MREGLVSVTIKRFRYGTDGAASESRALKTWAEAAELVREWGTRADTVNNHECSVMVRPRWKNGLCLYEVPFSKPEARAVGNLGAELFNLVNDSYGGGRRRLTSVKACVARECLARCAWNDAEAGESMEDARTLDVVTRALHAMYPDEAPIHVDRIRAWMLDGGKIR